MEPSIWARRSSISVRVLSVGQLHKVRTVRTLPTIPSVALGKSDGTTTHQRKLHSSGRSPFSPVHLSSGLRTKQVNCEHNRGAQHQMFHWFVSYTQPSCHEPITWSSSEAPNRAKEHMRTQLFFVAKKQALER